MSKWIYSACRGHHSYPTITVALKVSDRRERLASTCNSRFPRTRTDRRRTGCSSNQSCRQRACHLAARNDVGSEGQHLRDNVPFCSQMFMKHEGLQIVGAADYAAQLHISQRRKCVAAAPYINDLLEVATGVITSLVWSNVGFSERSLTWRYDKTATGSGRRVPLSERAL